MKLDTSAHIAILIFIPFSTVKFVKHVFDNSLEFKPQPKPLNFILQVILVDKKNIELKMFRKFYLCILRQISVIYLQFAMLPDNFIERYIKREIKIDRQRDSQKYIWIKRQIYRKKEIQIDRYIQKDIYIDRQIVRQIDI